VRPVLSARNRAAGIVDRHAVAALLQQSFEVDPLACPTGGGAPRPGNSPRSTGYDAHQESCPDGSQEAEAPEAQPHRPRSHAAPLHRALDKSEAVEVKVQEAADELVAVNDALAEEIDERDALEHRMTQSDSELSKSRAAERSARHRALHQALTDLPNATLFGDRLAQGLEQASRHRWQLAVMFIDLDGFKQVNDRHGHDAGDRVLRTVARRLRAAVRGGDSVGHRSGDEFLLLMLEVRDAAAVTEFAERLRTTLAEPIAIDGGTATVESSIGIALYPEHGASAAALLTCADQMMYRAKRGKVGVVLCDTPASGT